jgi:hypothetical protein
MGIFTRLFGGAIVSPPSPLRLEGPGTFTFDIVGEASYQPALESLCGGRTEDGADVVTEARLVCEDSNRYDSNAVRVDIDGNTVGYLSRDSARHYRKELERRGHGKRDVLCEAEIRGGWDRGENDRGHFGVKLDLPFGA